MKNRNNNIQKRRKEHRKKVRAVKDWKKQNKEYK